MRVSLLLPLMPLGLRCAIIDVLCTSSSTIQALSLLRSLIYMYQFDASLFAWSIGRLGLRSRLIVAFTNNGSTPLEELISVNLGVTFEFLILPHLCARPRLELADPQSIEAMRVLAFKWKRYLKLKADSYNPRTQNHCLFMCAAYILRRHGIVMTQQQVRDRTAKLWLAGAECFGGSLHHWAAVRQLTSTSFIEQLRSTGWGSAADACIFANSLQASCYIYDHRDWLVTTIPLLMMLLLSVLNVTNMLAIGFVLTPLSIGDYSRIFLHIFVLVVLVINLEHRELTQVTPTRQFQIVGRGEDGFTPHIVQNEHDLAIHAAHAPVPEEDQPAMEGYSCTLPLEDDDRLFILTRLRQLSVQLFAIARVGPHREGQEDLGDYQSRGTTPKPSCSCSFYQIGSAGASDGEEPHDYDSVDWDNIWNCSKPCASEYESDYDPSSMGRSLSAQWNGSQLTDAVLSPFDYAFDNVEDDVPAEPDYQHYPYRFYFKGEVPGCAYCRAYARLGEEPCQRCNGRLLPPVLHCGGALANSIHGDLLGQLSSTHSFSAILLSGGALRIVTHSTSGQVVHDIAECGTLTVQGFVELHEWTNVSVIWRHHVLHSDLLFADYKLDTL
eukprot:2358036-Amphidinium_carterae.1